MFSEVAGLVKTNSGAQQPNPLGPHIGPAAAEENAGAVYFFAQGGEGAGSYNLPLSPCGNGAEGEGVTP